MKPGKKTIKRILLAVIPLALLATVYFVTNPKRPAQSLLVYCAAGARMPVFKLAQQFSADCGVKVELRYGGSGTLYREIENSRAGDLFIASDSSFVNMAAGKGLIAETMPLAAHRPVVVVPATNPKEIRSLDDLLKPMLRLALGDPQATSIGRQTRNLLFKENRWETFEKQVRDRGAFKSADPEIADAVDAGSADAGIVWDSTAGRYDDLLIIRVPAFDVTPAQNVTAGVLTCSAQPAAALRFARYLGSEPGRAVFLESGFQAVEPGYER